MNTRLPTTPPQLTALKHDTFIGTAYEVVCRTIHGLPPDETQKSAAASYAFWAGLAEQQKLTSLHAHLVAMKFKEHWLNLNSTVKRIEKIIETFELNAPHPYVLLARTPLLLPALLTLGVTIPDTANVQKNEQGEFLLPPKLVLPKIQVADKSVQAEVLVAEDDILSPRIDLTLAKWLATHRLDTSENITDFRIYFSVLGCILLANYDQDRRNFISRPRVVHILTRKTAIDEANARKSSDAEKARRKAERKAEQTKKHGRTAQTAIRETTS
jgi:hypothetical protein